MNIPSANGSEELSSTYEIIHDNEGGKLSAKKRFCT